jgi:hypothetical protein
MTRVGVADHQLTAMAALVWNGDLPRPLQQILVDTADAAAPPTATSPPATCHDGQQHAAELIGAGTLAIAGC